MPTSETLKEFARLAVRVGTNPKKGQFMVINAPVEACDFVRMCVKEAYDAGAGEVLVDWQDNAITRMNYEYVGTDTLKVVSPWQLAKMQEAIDKGYCALTIASPNPELLKDIDSEKIKTVSLEHSKATKPFTDYIMNGIGQWSIVAYPNKIWAKKVFPDLSEDEAYDKLWEAILYTSRVFEGHDVVEEWKKHSTELKKHAEAMNTHNFKTLHFKNGYGTDLKVGLVKDHVWCVGELVTPDGTVYHPDIPTEEVFTMPDRLKVNGTVVSTKPLSINGKVISRFKLTFKDGRVTEAIADDNQEALDQILDTDEGSRFLGEVALISHNTPISQSGVLFYDTLFDENASCHLALGACYPMTVKGGDKMSTEELLAIGGNDSLVHVDFMFGSEDMSVIGETYDGKMIPVFKEGNFCI